MLPMVSIVVPARNEEKVIENCIKSLLKLNYPKNRLEIVVVTDTNTDRTLEICKKYEPKIKIFLTRTTNCKAEALNIVIPKLKGEIIAIFDADCIIDKNCVINAVKRFSDKKVMGVMGQLRTYNNKQNIVTRIISLENNFVWFQEYLLDKLGYNVNFLGIDMFVRKEVFKKIGYLDEYSYSEDTEFSTRFRKNKYKVVLEPSAITYEICAHRVVDVFKQKLRLFRSVYRIKRKLKYKTSSEMIQDVLHGFYFYISSLSSILFLILILNLIFFKLTSIFLLTLPLILLHLSIILFSNIYFKEDPENLLLIPIYLIFFDMYFYAFLKAWYKERNKEPMQWYKVKR